MNFAITTNSPQKANSTHDHPEYAMTAHPMLDHDPALSEFRRLTKAQFDALVRDCGEAAALAYVEARAKRLKDAETDPLRHGFELPHWPDVRHLITNKDETYILGANDSGKTELAGKLAVEVLTGRLTWPGMLPGKLKVLCIAQNEGASKQYQQSAVYKYLPLSARSFNTQATKKRSVVTKINYSQSGGFTEGTFVLPGGAQCFFKTVEQYQRDPVSFEGPAYHLVIIDEPAPLSLVQTLGFRAAKVGGKIVFCFTAVQGFDAVCANILNGARIVRTLPMNWDWFYRAPVPLSGSQVIKLSGSESSDRPSQLENLQPENLKTSSPGGPNPEITFPELSMNEVQVDGCPPGHMPYIMQPLDFNKGVIFTWAHWNPFPPRAKCNRFLTRTADKCVGKGKRIARVRLFGWAEKISGCQFPSFKTEVHVLPHEKIMKLLGEGKLTTYLANDPRPARSHFLIWCGVDALGRKYFFDESPRYDEAEWATMDGEKGEGPQVYAGAGVDFYKKHIREREREHGQEAFRRFGDPRAFATESATAKGSQNYMQLFAADGSEEDADLAPMLFEPAKVKARVSMEIDIINTALAYDDKKPLSVENEPKAYFSERCGNVIRAVLNWTPKVDGLKDEDNPWCDPIDALRQFFGEPLYYQDPNVPEVVGGRGWG